MWYFSWILGTALAICFAVVNAVSLEHQETCRQKTDTLE